MLVFQRLSCLSAGFLFVAAGLIGQTTNGSIGGAVTDPSGAAVAGVQVKVSNATTGLQRTATTLANGTYNIPQLPPGVEQHDWSGRQGTRFQRLQELSPYRTLHSPTALGVF